MCLGAWTDSEADVRSLTGTDVLDGEYWRTVSC